MLIDVIITDPLVGQGGSSANAAAAQHRFGSLASAQPPSSLCASELVITVDATSYLGLVGAVSDAIGDICPGLLPSATRAGDSSCSSASLTPRNSCYFVMQSVPWMPRLVIACEETFGFLEEGYGAMLRDYALRNGALPTTLSSSSSSVSSRPRLHLVVSCVGDDSNATRSAAVTRALCTLPRAVVASDGTVAAMAAGGAAGGIIATRSAALSPHFASGRGSSFGASLPLSQVIAEPPRQPMVTLVCSTEKIPNSGRIPLAATYREMWRNITSAVPRITKGVFRIVAKAPPPPPPTAHTRTSTAPSMNTMVIDVESEDEFAVIRPQLVVGTLVLEALDLCRKASSQFLEERSGMGPQLQKKSQFVRELAALREGVNTSDRQGSDGDGSLLNSEQTALAQRLAQRQVEHRGLLDDTRARAEGSDGRVVTGSSHSASVFQRGASLD